MSEPNVKNRTTHLEIATNDEQIDTVPASGLAALFNSSIYIVKSTMTLQGGEGQDRFPRFSDLVGSTYAAFHGKPNSTSFCFFNERHIAVATIGSQ